MRANWYKAIHQAAIAHTFQGWSIIIQYSDNKIGEPIKTVDRLMQNTRKTHVPLATDPWMSSLVSEEASGVLHIN